MPRREKPNMVILGLTLFLVIFGLLMIASSGAVVSQEKFGQSFYFVKNQIIKGLLPGLALGFLAYLIPYKTWRKYAKYIFLITLAFMILVFIPGIGVALGGAKRWVDIAGINFQPSELFKIGFIIYLAAFLEKNSDPKKSRRSGFISFLAILFLLILLIGFQPDIGTLGIFFLTALAMYFMAEAPLSHLVFLGGLGLGAVAALIKIFPHALQRIQVLFNPQLDPTGIGYQIDQSLIALGTGGLFGQGLTQGKQKFLYLPQPAGDSIVAVIGEELGFLGMFMLCSSFIIFAFYGLRVAKNSPDKFSKLLAAGITSLIVTQAFVNILAIIGLIPLTGIPLPFVSYGGSSLVVSLIAVGILLNISKHSKV